MLDLLLDFSLPKRGGFTRPGKYEGILFFGSVTERGARRVVEKKVNNREGVRGREERDALKLLPRLH